LNNFLARLEQAPLFGVPDHRGANAVFHRIGRVAPLHFGEQRYGSAVTHARQPDQWGPADTERIVLIKHQISQLGTKRLCFSVQSRTSCAKVALSSTVSTALSVRFQRSPSGESSCRRIRERSSWRPSTKRRTSPTLMVSGRRASK